MRRGASRVRNITTAEDMAYDEDGWRSHDLEEKRRMKTAEKLGYHMLSFGEPFVPYTCPDCGCSVSLSAVEKHNAWHLALTSANVV